MSVASDDTAGGKEGPSEMPDESVPMWKSYLMKKSWVMCPTPPLKENDHPSPANDSDHSSVNGSDHTSVTTDNDPVSPAIEIERPLTLNEIDRLTPLPFSISNDEYLRLLRDAQREGCSAHSSARHSRSSSMRNSPHGSPKSPPNSPNTELSTVEEDFRQYYINHTSQKVYGPSIRTHIYPVSVRSSNKRQNEFLYDAVMVPEDEPTLRQPFRISESGHNIYPLEDNMMDRSREWMLEWSTSRSEPTRREMCQEHSSYFKQCSPNKRKSSYSIRTFKIGKSSIFSKEVIYTLVLTNLISFLIGTGLGLLLARRNEDAILSHVRLD